MAGSVEVTNDNRGAFKSAKDAAILSGLEQIGMLAEGHAKALCPVDTGRLRNSITHQVDSGEPAVYIGTNVEYAVFVELREDVTHSTGQAHYLRDAATNNVGEYTEAMRTALGNG